MTHRRGTISKIMAMAMAVIMTVASVPEAAVTVHAAKEAYAAAEYDNAVVGASEDEEQEPAVQEQDGAEVIPAEETGSEENAPAEEEPVPTETVEEENDSETSQIPEGTDEDADVFETMEDAQTAAIDDIIFEDISAKPGINSVAITPYVKFQSGFSGYLYFRVSFWQDPATANDPDWKYEKRFDKLLSVYSSGNYNTDLLVQGVFAERTTYKYKVVLNTDEQDATKDVVGTLEGTFTTKKDTRRITKVEAEGTQKSATFYVTYEGGYKGDYNPLAVYCRQKGKTGYFKLFTSRTFEKAGETAVLSHTGLLNETEYEYVATLWIGNPEDIYEPEEGNERVVDATDIHTFSTVKENRKMGTVSCSEAIKSVIFDVPFSGSLQGECSYISVFYRKNGTNDGYGRSDVMYSYKAEDTVSVRINWLDKETTYDYIVVLSDEYPSSFTSSELEKLDVASDEAKEKGILGKQTGTFTTKADTREVITSTHEATYKSARIKTGFTGSIKNETTYFALYYRRKGSENFYTRKWSNDYEKSNNGRHDTAAYEAEYVIEGLETGAEYEAVMLISDDSINGYPLSATDAEYIIGQEVRYTFSTKQEGRKLTKPVADASYTTMSIRAGYEGNLYGDSVYIQAYYRESGTEGDYTRARNALLSGWAEAAEGTVTISSLRSGKTYDYAVVLSDSNDFADTMSQTALDAINPDWVKSGEQMTLSADFDASVTYDEKNSEVGYTVFGVTLTGDFTQNPHDEFTARLTIYKTEDTEKKKPKYLSVYVKKNMDYKASQGMTSLEKGTEYIVDSVGLYEGVDGSLIQRLTKEGSDGFCRFTTKAAGAATDIALPSSKIYLNLNESDRTMTVSFTPANASRALAYTYEPADADVVSVSDSTDENGVTTIKLSPLKVGSVTVKVASALAPDTELASFEVYVADYVLAEVPAAGDSVVPLDMLTLEKDASSGELAVYSRASSTGKYTTKVDDEITLEAGKDIVSLKDNKLIGINIGQSEVLLCAGGYPVSATVKVEVKSTGFIINGLTTNSSYPAIVTRGPEAVGNGMELEATVAAMENYYLAGYLSPVNKKLSVSSNMQRLELTVLEGEDNGVSVSNGGSGRIYTGSKAAYDAKILVSAVNEGLDDKPWTTQTVTIILHVLPAPASVSNMGYVLSNVTSKLGDIKLQGEYAGWEWDDDPSTPLFNADVTGGTVSSVRTFGLSYKGKDKYPCSQSIDLHVITMTSVDIITLDKDTGRLNDVVQLKNGNASVDFIFSTYGCNVNPQDVYEQLVSNSQYKYQLSCTDKNTAGIQYGEYRDVNTPQNVVFTQAGTYHFKVDVLSQSNQKIVSALHTVKVVEAAQVYHIRFQDAAYGDKSRLSAEDRVICLEQNKYIVSEKKDAEKGLLLTVEATDAEDNALTETKFEWKASDSSVVSVSTDATTKSAVIKPKKGIGNALISVTAKDDKRTTVYFRYEYVDRAPRIEKKALRVNLACDTDTDIGKRIAYQQSNSVMEIVATDSTVVRNIKLYERKAATWETEKVKKERKDFGIISTSASDFGSYNEYLAVSSAGAKSGKHNFWMIAEVHDSSLDKTFEYAYPLTITAYVKKPSVTVKTSGKINLFYRERERQEFIYVGMKEDDFFIPPVIDWKDESGGSVYGFSVPNGISGVSSQKKGTNVTVGYEVTYPNVRVNNGQLLDKGIDKGTVTVLLPGIRKEYGGVVQKKSVKIATTYKKPTLATYQSSTTTVKNTARIGASFRIYNKTESTKNFREELYYKTTPGKWSDCSSITTDTAGVALTLISYSYDIDYTYTGSKNMEKICMTVHNPQYWREPLTVTHTINNIEPTAELSTKTITVNSRLDDFYMDNVFIGVKADGTVEKILPLSDVKIEGAGDKEKNLLKQNFIELYAADNNKAELKFNQNAVKALGGTLRKGSYRFKITPYYVAADGKNTELKPVTLTVKVVDKPISVKTTAKGSLDIAQMSYRSFDGKKSYVNRNAINIKPRFSNMPASAEWTYELTGAYAEYFDLYENNGLYLGFKGIKSNTQAFNQGLRAGTTVPLNIAFAVKVKGADGKSYTAATLNRKLSVKLVQSAPKINVKYTQGKNTLYAGAWVSRSLSLWTADTYKIYSAYGSLDCNKDGEPDIEVKGNTSIFGYSNSLIAEIILQDRDAVFASASGRTLKIPVTVCMMGSDGISKNSTVTIKVKVKK